MSDYKNQLATDLGVSSAETEQPAEMSIAQDTQSTAEDIEPNTESDVDVASEIEARKEASRQATLQGQIKSYQSKLDNGKITIDQVPQYLQKHLKYESHAEEETDENDIDKLVEKKLEERLAKQSDEQIYKSKMQEIKESSLSKDDKTRLIAKWEFYKDKGFMDGEALAEAMEVVGIKTNTNKASNPQGAVLPKASTRKTRESYKLSEILKLSTSEYANLRKRQQAGEIDILDDGIKK